MTEHPPALQRLIDQVQSARASGTPLRIRGGGTKDFYGEAPHGEPLETAELAGISSYEPTELVITARAGTPLADVEAALAERGQCLPFEPPRFAGVDGEAGGTVGGMVAAGLSGPARASVGAVRDYVLGATVLNGQAEVLGFGGQVIKNVAGYDVSRLMVGSLGTLGVILEVSIKVLPVAPATATLRFECEAAAALDRLHAWGGQPLPLNASALWRGMLVVRLSGAVAAVQAARTRLEAQGAEAVEADLAASFWRGLRDQRDEFFAGAASVVQQGGALWRVSLPQTAPALAMSSDTPIDDSLIEWAGAQRWCVTPDVAPETVAAMRAAATRAGGHATLFRSLDKSPGVFTPLTSPLDRVHRGMKQAFDPDGVFNPGRLYPGL